MTNPTSAKLSEQMAVLAVVDPDVYTTGATTSDWLDMSKHGKIWAVVFAGDLGAGSTVNFKLQEATSSTGAGAADITGKAITAHTATGTDSNKQAIIDLDESELTIGTGRYVAGVMTIAGGTTDTCAAIFGGVPKHGPASDNDLASVDEIV